MINNSSNAAEVAMEHRITKIQSDEVKSNTNGNKIKSAPVILSRNV